MKILFSLIIASFIFIGCESENYTRDIDPDLKKEVLLVSQKWIELIDNEKYNQSWDEASEGFKASITKEKWGLMVGNIRPKFGKVLERKVSSMIYTTSLPNAPSGKYIVIRYHSKFSNIDNVTETITPSKDKNGEWHISGYFIKE